MHQDLNIRWNFNCTKLDGSRIYFDSSKGFGFVPDFIGLFDLNVLDVIWEYGVEGKASFGIAPNSYGKHFDEMDSLGRLRFFAEESRVEV